MLSKDKTLLFEIIVYYLRVLSFCVSSSISDGVDYLFYDRKKFVEFLVLCKENDPIYLLCH